MNPTAPTIGQERRTATRRQPTLGTVCRLDQIINREPGVGLVWNISASGVSMLLNSRLERGSSVKCVLATSNDAFALPITLRIAHVAKLLTGDYLVGGQFDRPIAADQMRHFLPESVSGV